MRSLEALEKIYDLIEYITRIDYVEPIVRNEYKQELIKVFKDAKDFYSKIKNSLEVLEILKRYVKEIKEFDNSFANKRDNTNYPPEYCIFFDGFEGKNGDLSKEDFDKLKKELEK